MQRMYKKIIGAMIACAVLCVTAEAQDNSPYSQYAFGKLSDPMQGFNRGMNGLGIAFRESGIVNSLNPASYSAVDSLTMIVDAGLTGMMTNYKEGGKSLNSYGADFDYATAAFRLFPGLGVGIGLRPYSAVDYKYSTAEYVGGSQTEYYTNTYSGSGGTHEVFLGVGAQLIKGLSVGVNAAYFWGEYTKAVSNGYSNSYENTLSKYYTAGIKSYKIDAGLQYDINIGKNDQLTIGFTYGYGHKLNSTPRCKVISYNSTSGVSDTTTYSISNGLAIPNTFGVGLSWRHAGKLSVGADYTLQKWGDVDFPAFSSGDNEYVLLSDILTDRHKVTIGGEYIPNITSRNYLKRVRYSIGASYTTPYIRVNGADGPKEIGVSAGLSLPISNGWNNRSFFNISAQWIHSSAEGLISENSYRINIGIIFNERWFMKWKLE